LSDPDKSRKGVGGLTWAALFLLLGAVIYDSSQMIHAQLLAWGQSSWSEYHSLRHDPAKPACSVKDLDARYQDAKKRLAPGSLQGAAAGDDDLLNELTGGSKTEAKDSDDDLLGELVGSEPSKAKPNTEEDSDLLGELVGDPTPKATTKTKSPKTDDDDLLGELVDAKSAVPETDADLLGELVEAGGGGKTGPPASTPAEVASWLKAKTRCEGKHSEYRTALGRITGSVRAFRFIETSVAAIVTFGIAHLAHILAFLMLICALVATILRHHIALRPARTLGDDRVSEGAQLLVNGMLTHSSWYFGTLDAQTGGGAHGWLYWVWVVGFGSLALTNLYHLIKPDEALEDGVASAKSLLAIPLYTFMGLISGGYFLLAESHPSGLSIYVGRLAEHAILYIHVGLYVWVGMLLKRTELAPMSFDLVRPWKLPPELLAFVAVVGAALPTAYSGASGIFVIAVGAVIYEELRRAGARPQLALAATAMSGSMGVVLRPCLLVVIVASLNKQVTTDQLFSWGLKVFLLTAVLFLIVSMFNRQSKITVAPANEALPAMWDAAKPLLKYIALFAVILVVYAFGLNAHLDEHSAPAMLPVIIILFLLYDKVRGRTVEGTSGDHGFKVSRAIGSATAETTGHIGALLMLMGLSVCLGGVIERADLMASVPEQIGSVWLTMSILVVVLVLIGMTMDPYGAVILVSATIAEVAYTNGIDPVHFWMVVLVAFELGYLTPPVALNHLLTRQVVGDEEFDASATTEGSFWNRHERILLPITVMGIALVIVAYAPLILG
jgi:TRAP-type C4-dicarboxylate transport system permease large subunit